LLRSASYDFAALFYVFISQKHASKKIKVVEGFALGENFLGLPKEIRKINLHFLFSRQRGKPDSSV